MNWKPEVMVAGNGDKWSQNALVFATEAEALQSARDLMSRWMMVMDCRAAPTTDPVNYRIVDNVLTAVTVHYRIVDNVLTAVEGTP